MTDNAAVVDAIYEAFASGDIETVLGALDPKIEWLEAAGSPYAGTYTGPEAVLNRVLARLGTEWETFHVEPERIVSNGDAVIAAGTYTGTYKTTRRTFTARFAHIWQLRDGKIIAFEQIADTAKINEAL